MKSKKWIEEQVCKIMYNDGPDQHTDGADIIADFIEALMKGEEDEWFNNYKSEVKVEDIRYKEWLNRMGTLRFLRNTNK